MKTNNTYALPISPYKDKCNGFAAVGTEDKQYVLGVTVGIGVSGKTLSHTGSTVLDETNAFDLAEIDGPYIGQLNMSIVSSFCGPQGCIWGYDLANNLKDRKTFEDLDITEVRLGQSSIKVYNGDFLVEALQELFGTSKDKKFNIIPGAHTPFASKNIKQEGPAILYAAIAIGIPTNRGSNACLLMEDMGTLSSQDITSNKREVVENLAKSILQVGSNQGVEYTECYIVFKYKEVHSGEIGCALVAAPYFTIAQEAIPKSLIGKYDFKKLLKMDLEAWKSYIKKL